MMKRILQRKLDYSLMRDPQYLKHLAPLAGASIVFELTDLRMIFSLKFQKMRIEVGGDLPESTLHLTGNSLYFLLFMLNQNERQKLLKEQKIKFEGRLLLLEELDLFWKKLRFDFPFWLKRSILFLGTQKKKIRQFLENQVERQQEDTGYLVPPILYQAFVDDLLALQQSTERLSARLTYLNDREHLQS